MATFSFAAQNRLVTSSSICKSRPECGLHEVRYASFADFSDPDGNRWSLQERGTASCDVLKLCPQNVQRERSFHGRSLLSEGACRRHGRVYREAGPKDAPAILLLHGFPTAGHMFRDLIPQLADRFRLVAPDLPGFGQSDMPARSAFVYTFETIAHVIDRFTEVIGLHRFAVYVFDYGAPVGFRLAARRPDRIVAIISQNGNARGRVERGLECGRSGLRPLAKRSAACLRRRRRAGSTRRGCPTRLRFRRMAIPSTTSSWRAPARTRFSWICSATTRATSRFTRPSGIISGPATLVSWLSGERTIRFFLPRGAEAFKRDIPGATIRFFETGHFALETHAKETAAEIRKFFAL